MQNNKTLSTSFNEEELYNQLREVGHNFDWTPDELVVTPEFYNKLEAYCVHYIKGYDKNPNPTYCGIKITIKNDLDKPFKFMRGGKEV